MEISTVKGEQKSRTSAAVSERSGTWFYTTSSDVCSGLLGLNPLQDSGS